MAKIGSRNWQGVKTTADLTNLPTTVDRSPQPLPKAALLMFGGILVVFLTSYAGDAIKAGAPVVNFKLLGLFGISATLLFLGWGSFSRRYVTFAADRVTVESRGPLGTKTWSLPYRDFKGVLHRVETRQKTDKQPAVTYQIVELLHEDRSRCIPLSVGRGTETPRDRWEGYARRLGLPALEIGAEGVIAREAEDLDKSLRELAAEGKVGHRFDPEAAVPRGLRLERLDGDRLRIFVTATRGPVWILGIVALAGLALALFAFTAGFAGFILFGFGLLFMGAPAFFYFHDRGKPRILELDRRQLRVTDNFPTQEPTPEEVQAMILRATAGLSGDAATGGRRGAQSSFVVSTEDGYHTKELPLRDLETVKVDRIPKRAGFELVIAGDRLQFRFGAGLSKPALIWLKNFLTAAVATA